MGYSLDTGSHYGLWLPCRQYGDTRLWNAGWRFIPACHARPDEQTPQNRHRWRIQIQVIYIRRLVRDGVFTSLNPENGEVYKQARLTGALGRYWSSPVAADDKILLASEDGKVVVLRADPEWEILAVNSLDE